MKKLINTSVNFVRESLQGFSLAHTNIIKVNFDPIFIYRAFKKDKVAIISGGGSGHEPLHGGFVGEGMLDAACPGEVFSSPTPGQMVAAAEKVATDKGVLFIVKNYSGDIMNFEMAAEMSRKQGLRVFNIVIDDDIAVKDSLYTQGRRGTGMTLLAEKICGAAAEQGMPLDQIVNLCRKVNISGRSMGIALTSCTTPAVGVPTFELGDDEMEIGIGIHGELGRARAKMKTADEIAEILTLGILDDGSYVRTLNEWDEQKQGWSGVELCSEPLKSGDDVFVFVNGLGGTPLSELYVVYRKVVELCHKKGLNIVDNLVGSYMTSLDMAGVTLTLMKIDSEMHGFWKQSVNTSALHW
jgi:phosphoenolpyruvate---glycerone phosphotransferase subunit DhaK